MTEKNPALECFCVGGTRACPTPQDMTCAGYHIEFGLQNMRERIADVQGLLRVLKDVLPDTFPDQQGKLRDAMDRFKNPEGS